ncbi:MAG TPA: Uma2 family endonuclease [Bryobacteraceae bacterium]|nr:Uma2 family endonuclease [Bryobacteraceae bacterium]
MGSTATLISLDEYLDTSYEPDMDFVDGVLVRRNVGTILHGILQNIVGAFFLRYLKSHRIRACTETRLRVDTSGVYRVPDVLVLEIPYQKGKVVTDVPAVVVEIKSPKDTFDEIVDRCFEYEKLGVPNILVVDPDNKRAWLFQHGNLQLLSGLSTPLNLPRQQLTIDFPFAEMFAELDED